jgi:hypothetical protein
MEPCATIIIGAWNHVPPRAKQERWMDLEQFILFFLSVLALSSGGAI